MQDYLLSAKLQLDRLSAEFERIEQHVQREVGEPSLHEQGAFASQSFARSFGPSRSVFSNAGEQRGDAAQASRLVGSLEAMHLEHFAMIGMELVECLCASQRTGSGGQHLPGHQIQRADR